MSDYQCPSCKSSQVNVSYPIIQCLKCGLREDLEDYAIGLYTANRETTFPMPYVAPYKVENPPNAFQELKAQMNHLQNQYNAAIIDPTRKDKTKKRYV